MTPLFAISLSNLPHTLQVSALPDGERAARLLDEVELLEEHLSEIKAYYQGRMSLGALSHNGF